MNADTIEGWSILELMGHRRLAGYLTEVEAGGSKMWRIDVPTDPPATQFYSGSAVYCITPTSEATARAVAKASEVAPVSRWELPAGPARVEVEGHAIGEVPEDYEPWEDD